jgi:hypothetical protein
LLTGVSRSAAPVPSAACQYTDIAPSRSDRYATRLLSTTSQIGDRLLPPKLSRLGAIDSDVVDPHIGFASIMDDERNPLPVGIMPR